MAFHGILVPDMESLPLEIGMEALRRASLHQTAVPGEIPAGSVVDPDGDPLDKVTAQLERDRDELREKAEQTVK